MHMIKRPIGRRTLFAAAATVASAMPARKPRAAEDEPPLRGLADALVPVDPPILAPTITFKDASGTAHSLGECAGHGMVVNLWATWCAPCVAELPSLAGLAALLAPQDIAVLPLSSDRGGIAAVQRFFKAHGVTGLPALLDPDGEAARAWDARGLPTTLIIDRQGRERARLEGSADWAAPDAAEIVRRLVLS